MNRQITRIFLFFIFLWPILSGAQTLDGRLPDSWVGKWSGDLQIYAKGRLQSTVPMNLVIGTATEGKRDFLIQYGTQDSRPYTLVTLDPESGKYLLDENNSIRMEEYMMGDKLVSLFSVSGSLILSQIRMNEAGNLVYEILSFPSTPVSQTGNTVQEGEEIPAVSSYELRVLQTAILKKLP